jgi:hypothetical protein
MAGIQSVPFMPMLPRLMMHRDWFVFPAWAHPQVRYWAPTWMIIRDCLLGDQEIKDKGETYLPKMADMDQDEYARYLDAAVFFNMTARTVNALTGTVFQRTPKITGVPKILQDDLDNCVWNGISVAAFLTTCVEGVIAMGRFGLLVDRAADGKSTPFIRGYDTENIVDWQMDWVNGRYVPVQIILREFIEINSRRVGEIRKYKIIYRVLSLDVDGELITTPSNNDTTLSSVGVGTGGGPITTYAGGAVAIQSSPVELAPGAPVYRQYVYTVNNISAPLNTITPEVITPTNRGATMDFIPFTFVGAKDNTPDVDRPPAADIAKLNLAHYRAYAHLEHGRYFCAMPIYYVQVMPHSEKAEYTLGPSRVWEVAQGEKPGILEFNGQGLKTLENSLSQKEEQIAMIGGRLVGGLSRSVSESDNQAKVKESNERSLLLKVVQNTEEGFEKALNWWCWWQDQPNSEAELDLNTAFIFDNLGARELRAAHQMYAEGVIPITALHNYLLKAEIIPEYMDIDQFKSLLGKVEEFPNQPDVWARQMGYSDAAHRHDVRLQRRELRNTEDMTEIDKQRADQELIDIEGNIDVKQQLADVQQQLADVQQQIADQQAQQGTHDQAMDKKQHELSQKEMVLKQKVAMKAASAAGRPVVKNAGAPPKPKNPNSTALPKQVAAARQSTKQ